MELMNIRRGLMAQMAKEQYSIELYPVVADRTIPCVQFAVIVGQKITVSWKADALYTNRYIMRGLNAILDNGAAYKIYTPSTERMVTGTKEYVVTTAGNILFGGYSVGLSNTCLIGEYIKVKIENPE